ncbi:MAG TPA: hypothetical protein VI390_00795, partial [Methyloceanibacter sp.]
SDWDFWELVWPQIFRGVGLMTAIIPINNVALGTLPPEKVKNASGLYIGACCLTFGALSSYFLAPLALVFSECQRGSIPHLPSSGGAFSARRLLELKPNEIPSLT